MKKIIGLIAVMLGAGVVYAQQQQLTFLTVLPDPVASFDKLEVADTQNPAFARNVVFGTPNTRGGNIDFVGPVVPDLPRITLMPGTSLVGNNDVQSYGLHTLQVGVFGRLTAKRLFAGNVFVPESPGNRLVIGVTHEGTGGPGAYRDVKLLKFVGFHGSEGIKVGNTQDLCIKGVNGNCTTRTNVDAYMKRSSGGVPMLMITPASWWTVGTARDAFDTPEGWQWSQDSINEPSLNVYLLRQN